MRIWWTLLACAVVVSFGCKRAKDPAAESPRREKAELTPPSSSVQTAASEGDACALIPPEEVQAVQGSPIKETKGSSRQTGQVRVAQCFYTAAEFNRSVSLAVTQIQSGGGYVKPADVWQQTFGRYSDSAKDKDEQEREERANESTARRGEREEEEHATPPLKIEGVGEKAYWTSNSVGGALYVLSEHGLIRISIGGPDDNETRVEKSKALALKAIARLEKR